MQKGFTLIELVVTVLIISIVATLGVSSFQNMGIQSYLATYSNELLTSFIIARTEAIKRNKAITICPSEDQATCSDEKWAQGWIIFVDEDSDGTADTGEEILRIGKKLKNPSSKTLYIIHTESATLDKYISYLPSGRVEADDKPLYDSGISQVFGFIVCKIATDEAKLEGRNSQSRHIILGINGQPEVRKTAEDEIDWSATDCLND